MTAPGDERSHPTRELILREAARIFAERGYHGTGLTELERAVGIKRGALYHHIRSKEDLLAELSVRHLRRCINAGTRIVADGTDPVSQIRALARMQLRMLADHRTETIVWQRESHALSGAHADGVRDLRDAYEEIFASVVRRGVADGWFRNERTIVVKGLLGMLGYTYLWLRDGELSPEQVADELMDVVLHGQLTEAGRRAATVPVSPSDRPA